MKKAHSSLLIADNSKSVGASLSRPGCQLVKIPNVFEFEKKEVTTLPIVPGTVLRDVAALANFNDNAVIIYNGRIEEDLGKLVLPGDIIHVIPRIHKDAFQAITTIALIAAAAYIAPPAGAWLAGTIGVGSATFWGGVVSFALLTAGGMLINSTLSPPAAPTPNSKIEESPTYGWELNQNTAEEGLAIPVAYGRSRSTPQVINHYLEIDSDGNQWVHLLLCVAEGLANNVPTADDIYINDELLSFYGIDSYELYVTDGSNTPNTGQLTKFQKLHQYRTFQKRVRGSEAISLLHFNGSEGSTVIVEESSYDHNWACHNNADLITSHPWGGSANLDLLGASDYITSDNEDAFDIFTETVWDIEFRFRQPSLTDSGIVGQWVLGDLGYYYCGVLYMGGKLYFQQFKWVYDTYTIYFNVSGSVSLSVDTWYHIRVARNGNTVYLFLDGSLVASGVYGATPVSPPSDYEWHQGIGRAYYYDSGGPSRTLYYAQAEIDEFRFVRDENLYSLSSFTPPSEEAMLGVPEYYETNGVCDGVTVIIEASYGLYSMNDQGDLKNLSVNFEISYRKKGESAWTTNNETITAKSRYAVKKQFNYAMPSRDQYEVQVLRISPEHDDDTRKQSRTYWTGLDEILDEFLSYPNLQLVSVSLKAQDEFSGRVPVIRIVNNRDAYTNNADAAYDMLTNSLYGGGVESSRFDSDAWEDWKDWCNDLIGGNKRCQFNMIMDAQYSMDEALQHVENAGRAKIVMRGTKISVVIEKPEQPSFLFSSGNIKPASAKVSFLPQAEKSDAVEIQFIDKDNLWQRNTAFAPGAGYETLTRVPRITRLFLPAIDNYDQAMREAILRQQISEGIKRSIELESGIEGIVSTVGDVIRFAHEGNSLVAGGRLAADGTGGQIRIDKKITLDSATYSGNCKIWIKISDDTVLEGTVDGPFDEETDLFSTSISEAVARFDNYIIGRATDEKYLYRLAGITRSGQKTVKVTGLQYNENSYYHADYNGGAVAI